MRQERLVTRQERIASLSIVLTGDEPPTEFRIFAAGEIDTKKGKFLFDDAAAKSVLESYEEHGIDLMIDYDHASVAGLSIDPAQSGKAAGWFNLAVRNGELWAVNVRWTPPAADALRRKEWRFMSPAFNADADGRVLTITNVAITNLPATRQLEPLMAASETTKLGDSAMTVEEFLKVCKALAIDMSSPLDEAMAKIKGEPDPDAATEDAPPPVGDGGADESTEPTAAAQMAPPPEKEKPAEVAASISRMMRLSEATSFADLLSKFETYRDSHLKLETETQKLAQERGVLEAAERRKLCVELVTLAGRSPAAVWADDKATAPKPYLMTMPISDLRAMHADEIKAKGGKPVAIVAPRTGFGSPSAPTVQLTADQLRICKETGCDPAIFATLAAQRDSVKTTGGI